jgi:hypothetical protein
VYLDEGQMENLSSVEEVCAVEGRVAIHGGRDGKCGKVDTRSSRPLVTRHAPLADRRLKRSSRKRSGGLPSRFDGQTTMVKTGI